MTFEEKLEEYISELSCSGKELAEASGLSAAVISRYRKGTRIPAANSDQLDKLVNGLALLSAAAGKDFSIAEIFTELTQTLKTDDFDFPLVNLNLLFQTLNINTNRLARFLNYDASYISRIRKGQRQPADPEAFIDGICRFISTYCTATQEKAALAELTEKSLTVFENQRTYFSAVRYWLCHEETEKRGNIDSFLNKLDDFDLNDYIRSIHFEEMKVPTVPFQPATVKSYVGLEQMSRGELDFFKATVLSHSTETIFMCSDMDMADMAKDITFGKKWMYAVALCIKKGLHLNIIHTLDRPFEEMMLGLESWLPIYMTGQVSPYYLKKPGNEIYQHLNYVSGAAALTGECIVGHHNKGKYYLTKKSSEVAYYREKSEFILKKAYPLMEIYREEKQEQFRNFLLKATELSGRRHGILSAPPIFTLPESLLKKILIRNEIPEPQQKAIADHIQTQRKMMTELLSENAVFDELPRLTQEELLEYPVYLSLEGLFLDLDIPYTYEEYNEHLQATAAYAEAQPNYTVSFQLQRAFRHMQIYIHEGQFAIVAKGNAPTVHFVIHQEKLRTAIENLILPVVETAE